MYFFSDAYFNFNLGLGKGFTGLEIGKNFLILEKNRGRGEDNAGRTKHRIFPILFF